MLSQMQGGQVTFDELVAVIHRCFEHVYLLWNGTNFSEFVASNDLGAIERFVSLAGEPCIQPEFCLEAPIPRRLMRSQPARHGVPAGPRP